MELSNKFNFDKYQLQAIYSCAKGNLTFYRLSKILSVSKPTAKRIAEKAKTQLSA